MLLEFLNALISLSLSLFLFLESFEVKEKNHFASFMDILKNVKIF